MKVQAKATVPFSKPAAAASAPRVALPAAPTGPQVDTGTVVANGSEISEWRGH